MTGTWCDHASLVSVDMHDSVLCVYSVLIYMVTFRYMYNTVAMVHILFHHALDQDQDHRDHTKPSDAPLAH